MKRREFSAWAAGAGLGALGLPRVAGAQGGPIEGTHYVRLSQPLPVQAAAGKIEVIEFFWYGCPHCFQFDPMLERWLKHAPPDVAFRRVHVAFAAPYRAHQRLFYALESLGREAQVHDRIFNAIHQQRQSLDTPEAMADFLAANGLERAQFLATYNSFGVQAKCQEASRLAQAYKIDGVPALGINGRYFTSGSLAGGNDRALAVADWLLERIRKGGG
jgi:thiol:disulfide interchange protein DsbA